MAALKQITHEELKEGLRKGSFKFYFRKVSGELRIALGTLDLGRVPSAQHPKAEKSQTDRSLIMTSRKANGEASRSPRKFGWNKSPV